MHFSPLLIVRTIPLLKNNTWFYYLLGLITFEAIADIFVKEYSQKKTALLFVISIGFYIVANICWLISMRYRSNLTIGANIFSVMGGLLSAMIGLLYYKEIISKLNAAGIILGVIALILLLL